MFTLNSLSFVDYFLILMQQLVSSGPPTAGLWYFWRLLSLSLCFVVYLLILLTDSDF